MNALLVIGIITVVGAAGTYIVWRAFFSEPQALDVTSHTVALSAVDRSIRIVQLTDLHLRNFGDHERRLLSKTADLRPDIIVLTGDYAESDEGLAALGTIVSELSGRAPVYAVLGDNDLEDPNWTQQLADTFERHGATVLRNEARYVEHNGQCIVIAGVEDPNTGHARIDPVRTHVRALSNKAPVSNTASAPVVLLAHSPEIALQVESWMDVVLTGHTHGGQICLPGGKALYTNTPACKGFASGWYTVQETTRLYVNRGVGTARIPARLFCPSEIAVFDLVGTNPPEG